jgi:hypothetical protein
MYNELKIKIKIVKAYLKKIIITIKKWSKIKKFCFLLGEEKLRKLINIGKIDKTHRYTNKCGKYTIQIRIVTITNNRIQTKLEANKTKIMYQTTGVSTNYRITLTDTIIIIYSTYLQNITRTKNFSIKKNNNKVRSFVGKMMIVKINPRKSGIVSNKYTKIRINYKMGEKKRYNRNKAQTKIEIKKSKESRKNEGKNANNKILRGRKMSNKEIKRIPMNFKTSRKRYNIDKKGTGNKFFMDYG